MSAFNLATHFVDRHLEQGRGERTALLAPGGPCSYAGLAELTNRIGHVLRDLGVRQEERVLLVLSDGVEFVATWYAVQKLGAVTAEAYTFLAVKDYAHYLEYTRAGVVVVDAGSLERVREAAPASRSLRHLLVLGARGEDLRPGEAHFESLVAQAPAQLDPAPTSADDIAIWKFTTGSTGAPKACVHRAGTALASHRSYAEGVLALTEDDVVLPVPKLFFGYARDMAALYPFGVGGAGIVYPERPTPERLFELIARHAPTILVNVPTMMAAMVDHPDAAMQDLTSVRCCTSAGEALPRELHARWLETFGVEVLDGLGSSEAYHIFISNRPGEAVPGSLGREVPGYRARVVDDAGDEVTDGVTGRLWVQGETAALMYWGAREKSTQTFAGDLVMTGDLVERDGDGLYWYRGRADDLLKVGGIWVAPAEIEQCLAGHPDVLECAVVGYAERGLVRPRAYVALVESATAGPDLADALREHVRSELSPHKRPRDVCFLDALPKTGSGKIDRRALKELDG